MTGRGIKFDHVSFRYPNGVVGLEDVTLYLPVGAFVGLVGPSGSGKTSFLDLVAGVLEPQAGRIDVQCQPLESSPSSRLRASLAYVAQDPFLFDDTLRRNLTWSRPDAEDDELLAILAMVGAEDLLRRLSRGLDTRIGERGVLISAGERQRVALARALLRRPALLILDEATNALDVEGQHAILERLAGLRPSVIMLMAVHRLESIALCDHVLEFPGPKPGRLLSARPLRTTSLGLR